MRRRDLLARVGAAAALWPGYLFAQSGVAPRIALLDPGESQRLAGFIGAMRDLGYVEGRNISYIRRGAEGRTQDFRQVATELVSLKPDVIVVASGQATRAVMQVTQTVPIVFVAVGDALNQGIVTSLSRPGGNATGASFLDTEVTPKRLQILHEIAPSVQRFGIFFDPANAQSELLLDGVKKAADVLGLRLQTLPVPGPALFESAFATLERENAEALHVLGSILFSTHRQQLTQLAAKYRLPAMYQQADFVRAGGFVAYGPSTAEMERYAAACVDKIIKGAKPQDIPVEQPTRFELVINLKTAKTLGLSVPPALLARADELIE